MIVPITTYIYLLLFNDVCMYKAVFCVNRNIEDYKFYK
jgi:hypothetical protein